MNAIIFSTESSDTSSQTALSSNNVTELGVNRVIDQNPVMVGLKQACPTFLARGPNDKFRQC